MSKVDRAKILIVGPLPPPAGGVPTFLQILLNSRLAEKYHLIHIDTRRDKGGQEHLNKIALINFYYLARQLTAALIACIQHRPQIIHVPITSGLSFWKGAAFILLGRLLGLKAMAHLHGGYFQKFFHGKNRRTQATIRWILSQASIIIVLSEVWKRFIQEEIKATAPVQVIGNTVDDMFADYLRSGRQNPPPTNGHKTVLFLGQMHEFKGVFDIPKAAVLARQERPELYFVIAGPEHHPGVAAQLREACEKEGLVPYIQIPGPIMGREKLDLFTSSYIFVLPSYAENFPYTVLEAMSTGLPVIATAVGALPEVLEEGVNGYLITPGDYRALAEKIVLLTGDEPLHDRMAQANRVKILERFTPETAIAELERIYDGLLSRPSLVSGTPVEV